MSDEEARATLVLMALGETPEDVMKSLIARYPPDGAWPQTHMFEQGIEYRSTDWPRGLIKLNGGWFEPPEVVKSLLAWAKRTGKSHWTIKRIYEHLTLVENQHELAS